MNANAARAHWFLLVAPVVLAIDFYAAWSAQGAISRIIEAGLLFDLVVLLPCLYWLCYRQSGRAALVRAAALGCMGIWLALKLIPEPERDLVVYIEPLRYVGLAALLYLELVVVLAIYRSVLQGSTVQEAASHAPKDMPPWLAKLLALEARFWLRVWQALRRLLRRK